MTAKELIMPRFEVIAEYPNCPFKKGEILVRIKHATNDIYHTNEDAYFGGILLKEIEPYPNLFRKLTWWEYRKEEDMPKKVMSMADDKGDTYEIESWDMNLRVGWINKLKRECCDLTCFTPEYGYVPID